MQPRSRGTTAPCPEGSISPIRNFTHDMTQGSRLFAGMKTADRPLHTASAQEGIRNRVPAWRWQDWPGEGEP